ncbi:uncharacterized protein [Lolium perenne]|uniref:uncharacterized protein n=1 Tax=Lolium perenne TaxID=4522 RepID=UPI003A994226
MCSTLNLRRLNVLNLKHRGLSGLYSHPKLIPASARQAAASARIATAVRSRHGAAADRRARLGGGGGPRLRARQAAVPPLPPPPPPPRHHHHPSLLSKPALLSVYSLSLLLAFLILLHLSTPAIAAARPPRRHPLPPDQAMKLKINKACDLASIFVLPPRRSRGSGGGGASASALAAAASQQRPRSMSQKSFSQGGGGSFSQSVGASFSQGGGSGAVSFSQGRGGSGALFSQGSGGAAFS